MAKPSASEVRDARAHTKEEVKRHYKLSDRAAEKLVNDACNEQERRKHDKKNR